MELKDVACNVCEEYRASIICYICYKPTCLKCILIESIIINDTPTYNDWKNRTNIKEINKCTQCAQEIEKREEEWEKKEEEWEKKEEERNKKDKMEVTTFCEFVPTILMIILVPTVYIYWALNISNFK